MAIKGDMKTQVALFAIIGGFYTEVFTINGPRWYSLKVDKLCRSSKMMERIHDYPARTKSKTKSKASWPVAKMIACIQAGWVLLNCLGRLLDNLHTSLL